MTSPDLQQAADTERLRTADEPPAAPKPATGQPYRGRRGQAPVKFAGSLRGQGVLISPTGETPVAYQLDVYESTSGRTGSGSLDGSLSAEEVAGPARLRLSDGAEFAIDLQEIDEAGAVFEAHGAFPWKPGA